MSRNTLIILTLISLIFTIVFFYSTSTSDNTKDSQIWDQFRKELNDNQIEKIIITRHFDQEILLNKLEQKEFLELLREAKFESSNREGRGSTSDGVFKLISKDRKELVNYLINGSKSVSPTFQLSPRHLDPDTQFYIKSEQLAKFIETKLPK